MMQADVMMQSPETKTFSKPELTLKNIPYNSLYLILCFIRIILVVLPQVGYIHPDEHFQGPEVVYGDLLQLKVYRPWEFTTEYPLRNIVFPYVITGFPSLLFKLFNVKEWVGSSYPYLLMVMPRLLMCGLTFLHDLLLYKVCILLKRDHKVPLIAFASSYVTLVFLTRTFSNSLESLFFSIMVYLLCKFMSYKNMMSDKNCNSQRFMNLSFMFGLFAAIGVFNRPTFLCYCIFPVLAYMFLLVTSNIQKKQIMNNLVSFGLGGLSILISFTAIDTLYYNKTHSLFDSYRNIKIISTPLNFILYNTDNDNLHQYGIHPRWLHSLINIPLLFSTIGVLVNLNCFKSLYNFVKVPSLNYKNIMYLVYLTPLLFLSLIPHQEPRFVIPLLFPVVLLFKDVLNMRSYKKTVVTIWLFQNTLAVIFFGFFHQGGVYTSSSFIYSQIQNNNSYSVVFYKTYMPPRYLLGIDQARKDVQVYDFGGVDINELDSMLKKQIFYLGGSDFGDNYTRFNDTFNNTFRSQPKEQRMLVRPQFLCMVVPQEVTNQVMHLPSIVSDYKFYMKKTIFPHLRSESISDYLVPNATDIDLYNIYLNMDESLRIDILLFKSK